MRCIMGLSIEGAAMLDFVAVYCPACGEPLELAIDASAGAQQYVEDCQVCCRPLVVTVAVDDEGAVDVSVTGEND